MPTATAARRSTWHRARCSISRAGQRIVRYRMDRRSICRTWSRMRRVPVPRSTCCGLDYRRSGASGAAPKETRSSPTSGPMAWLSRSTCNPACTPRPCAGASSCTTADRRPGGYGLPAIWSGHSIGRMSICADPISMPSTSACAFYVIRPPCWPTTAFSTVKGPSGMCWAMVFWRSRRTTASGWWGMKTIAAASWGAGPARRPRRS